MDDVFLIHPFWRVLTHQDSWLHKKVISSNNLAHLSFRPEIFSQCDC